MAYKVLLVSLLLCAAVYAEKCQQCTWSECPVLPYCSSGVSQDECGCCETCANKVGEKCDLPSIEKSKENQVEYVYGKCGTYLSCAENGVNQGTCVCDEEGSVCGSNGKTYLSICELLSDTSDNIELTLIEWAPCDLGPKIKSFPEDVTRPLGSILSLDCEATGYPVPTIRWELNRDDGTTIELPNDDSLVSVQVRGGPEKLMVTGWVQLMKILPSNVGYYTCIATNSKGEVRASAKVSIYKKDLTE